MKRLKQLRAGTSAPRFKTTDVLGGRVDMAAYDDSYTLLVFLRYSGCPWCNLAIHRLSMEYQMLSKNGCRVIAFVQSEADNIHKNIYGRHKVRPQYPIIGDPDRRLYDLYGVGESRMAAVRSIPDIPYWLKAVFVHGFPQTEVDGNLLMVPAMFLVGRGEQKIIQAEYGSSFYDHSTFTDIYEQLTFDS